MTDNLIGHPRREFRPPALSTDRRRSGRTGLRLLPLLTIGLLFLADPAAATHDTDGDGWSDEWEAYGGSDPLDDCSFISPYTWPPDFDADRSVDTGDMAQLTNFFGAEPTHPTQQRFDLHPDPPNPPGEQFFDTGDIAVLVGLFGVQCTP